MKIMCIYRCYIVNWSMNKLLLSHNPYSGAKHIPLSSQMPFHFHCSFSMVIWHISIFNQCFKVEINFVVTKWKNRLAPFAGAMKFTTQMSPLLNYHNSAYQYRKRLQSLYNHFIEVKSTQEKKGSINIEVRTT